MEELILASAVFVGIHVLVSGTPLRGALVRVIGEKGFLGLFSLLSIAALVWIIVAYRAFEGFPIWVAGPGAASFMPYGMLVVVFLIVAGGTAPNPAALGKESALDDGAEPTGILRITRHPVMWGIILWGALHLYATGLDKAVIVSVTMMITAWAGTSLIDRKRAKTLGEKWIHFAALTSNTPFGAIIERRNSLKLGEIQWWVYLATAFVWVGIAWIHDWLGVPTGIL